MTTSRLAIFFCLFIAASIANISISAQTTSVDQTAMDTKILNLLEDYLRVTRNSSEYTLKKEIEDGWIELKIVIQDEPDAWSGSVSFSTFKSAYHTYDLNDDGKDDYITEVTETYGNSDYTSFAVILSSSTSYIISGMFGSWDLTLCEKGYGSYFASEKYEGDKIIGTSYCYTSEDARCCPSIQKPTVVSYSFGDLYVNPLDQIEDPAQEEDYYFRAWDSTITYQGTKYLLLSNQTKTQAQSADGFKEFDDIYDFEFSIKNQSTGKTSKLDNAFWKKLELQYKLGDGVYGEPVITNIDFARQKIQMTIFRGLPASDVGHDINFNVGFNGLFEIVSVKAYENTTD